MPDLDRSIPIERFMTEFDEFIPHRLLGENGENVFRVMVDETPFGSVKLIEDLLWLKGSTIGRCNCLVKRKAKKSAKVRRRKRSEQLRRKGQSPRRR